MKDHSGEFLVKKMAQLKGLSINSKSVWVDEAYSTGSSADIRKVIDYLIRCAIEHFGEDMGSNKTHRYFA